jgi:hypothetical protein
MKIKILKDISGPGNADLGQGPYTFTADQVTYVHPDIAAQWIKAGNAEAVTD